MAHTSRHGSVIAWHVLKSVLCSGDTPEPPTPAGADTNANVSSTSEPARSASVAVLQPPAAALPEAAAAGAKPARSKKTARKLALAATGTAEGAALASSFFRSLLVGEYDRAICVVS